MDYDLNISSLEHSTETLEYNFYISETLGYDLNTSSPEHFKETGLKVFIFLKNSSRAYELGEGKLA